MVLAVATQNALSPHSISFGSSTWQSIVFGTALSIAETIITNYAQQAISNAFSSKKKEAGNAGNDKRKAFRYKSGNNRKRFYRKRVNFAKTRRWRKKYRRW